MRAKETRVDLIIITLQSGVWSTPCRYLVRLVNVGVPLTFRRCFGVVSTTAGVPVLWYGNVLECLVGQYIGHIKLHCGTASTTRDLPSPYHLGGI